MIVVRVWTPYLACFSGSQSRSWFKIEPDLKSLPFSNGPGLKIGPGLKSRFMDFLGIRFDVRGPFTDKNNRLDGVFTLWLLMMMTILVNQFQNGIFKPEFIGFIYGKTKAVPDETLEAMKSYYFSESVANLKKTILKYLSTLR